MSPNWLFLLFIPIVLIFIFFPILIMRAIRRSAGGVLGAPAGQNPFQQVPGETREDFVRRHWQRPGVVADGVTLVDLYDRIRVLEERAEQKSE